MENIKLFKKCQKGDQEAFNELIKIYYPYVYKFILRLVEQEDLAYDLVQETFMKFIKNIDKFQIKGSATLGTYLISIAKNTYIDYLRKNKNIILDEKVELWSDDHSLHQNMILNEDITLMFEYLNQLPYEQSQAIKLKYIEGLSLNEIAMQMNTETKTIKSRIHEGKKKLRLKLERKVNHGQ